MPSHLPPPAAPASESCVLQRDSHWHHEAAEHMKHDLLKLRCAITERHTPDFEDIGKNVKYRNSNF